MTCVGDHEYNCDYGVWRKYVNKTLGGNAQPFGTKKFTQLKSAQTFACDKGTDNILILSQKIITNY